MKHLREDEVVLYLDAQLDEAARERLGRHLADCSDCRARLAEFRSVQGLLDEWTAVEPSASFDAAVRERLRAEPRQSALWAWLRLRPVWGGVLLLAVVVALGLWQLSSPVPSRGPELTQQATQVEPASAPVPAPDTESGEADSLGLLDDPVLLENYELLAEFDVLFEPLQNGAERN